MFGWCSVAMTSALDHVYLDPVTLTDGCGGYMLMTAYLAFYDVV